MRVALIGPGTLNIPPKGWGATERVIWNIHRRSRDAGFESVILNARTGEELRAQCARLRPDVIHLHAHWRLEECLPYLISRPTPLVTTCHDARLSRRIPPEIAPSIELADAVIALSPSIREQVRALRDTNVYYIPNGVDTRVFRPLTKKPNTVVAVGRNSPRKRFATIARFFLAHPEYHLTMCGPNMLGRPDKPVPVIPTGPNITLLGNRSERAVARLLGEAEYFVHLADLEASALVVREAMACGCRVWTVPANAQDLRNVALSWEQAVGDPELGPRAACEAAESFDWSIIVRRHAAVYKRTLGQWRASTTSHADARRRYRAFAAPRAKPDARLAGIRDWIRPRLGRGISSARRWAWRLGGQRQAAIGR